MALADSTARKQVAEPASLYRSAPHNIEAEQALLGAILVNNEAFYRVSDFLEPAHFFEPIHQKVYQLARDLIRAGKLATPVTLKTFLDAGVDIGGLTVSQYLARLAAEATTIINAEDYGHTVYDLSIRRALIQVGEDMVNVAYDAPVDFSPRNQIEDAERRLYELAETGRYDGGFQRFAQALITAIDMAAHAFQRDGKLSGTATGLHELDRMMGGLQKSDLIILAGRPGMGKTALATNIAYNVAKAWVPGQPRPDGQAVTANGGIVGFFSLEMSAEQLATRIIAEQTGIPLQDCSRTKTLIKYLGPNVCVPVALDGARELASSTPRFKEDGGGRWIGCFNSCLRRLSGGGHSELPPRAAPSLHSVMGPASRFRCDLCLAAQNGEFSSILS